MRKAHTIHVGDWVVIPHATNPQYDVLGKIKGFLFKDRPVSDVSRSIEYSVDPEAKTYPDVSDYDLLDRGFSFDYFYTTDNVTLVKCSRGYVLRPLTKEESRDLQDYFNWVPEKLPLLINNKHLGKAVIGHMKHGTKPNPNSTFL